MSYDSGEIFEGQRRVVRMEGDPRDGREFTVYNRRPGHLVTWELDLSGQYHTIQVQGDYLTRHSSMVRDAGAWAYEDNLRLFSVAIE